jgi:SAM-dependent methyltransferase
LCPDSEGGEVFEEKIITMSNRYEKFYKDDWDKAYGFWHKIITRGQYQVEILKKTIESIDKDKITILDLGCGRGDETHEALVGIRNKKFSIVANDTSARALDEYVKTNSGYVVEAMPGELESLPEKLQNKFDLILFSHCLYSVKLKDLFQQYLQLLNDHGCILIFLDSNKSGIKTIQHAFWDEVHRVPFDENVAEDVIQELSRKEIPFATTEFSNEMQMDKLYAINKDGVRNLLVPFILRLHAVKKDIGDKVAAYISAFAKNGIIENNTCSILVKK